MKIKRYIMGNLDTAGCNLKCSYCFFNQWEPHEHTKQIFDYSIDHMQRSLTVERLGGGMLYNIMWRWRDIIRL